MGTPDLLDNSGSKPVSQIRPSHPEELPTVKPKTPATDSKSEKQQQNRAAKLIIKRVSLWVRDVPMFESSLLCPLPDVTFTDAVGDDDDDIDLGPPSIGNADLMDGFS